MRKNFCSMLFTVSMATAFAAFSNLAFAQGPLAARVSELENTVAALQAQVAQLSASQNDVSALHALLNGVSRLTVNGQPTLRFTGVNVQIVNGLDSTATANGTGNLIVGYDESDVSGRYRCTIGTNTGNTFTPDQSPAYCNLAGGTWTNQGFKTGSHYIVSGSQNNYSRWGGVVFGFQNTSNFDYASVIAGEGNTASGVYAGVFGGGNNLARGRATIVSGGVDHIAGGNFGAGVYASVFGGSEGGAVTDYSTILGGGWATSQPYEVFWGVIP